MTYARSTEFGSGALEGAVGLHMKRYTAPSLSVGYQSAGNENYQVIGNGGLQWSVGLARDMQAMHLQLMGLSLIHIFHNIRRLSISIINGKG